MASPGGSVVHDALLSADVAVPQDDRAYDGMGASPKRLEDVRLVKGSGVYVGDIDQPGMLFAVIVRSSHAHARIVKINASAATQATGFVHCFTAADVGPMHPIPIRMGPDPALSRYLQKPLASEVVRYAGEPVAIVVAETLQGPKTRRKRSILNMSRSKSLRTQKRRMPPGRSPSGRSALATSNRLSRKPIASCGSVSRYHARQLFPSSRGVLLRSSIAAVASSRCGARLKCLTSTVPCWAPCSAFPRRRYTSLSPMLAEDLAYAASSILKIFSYRLWPLQLAGR